MISRDLQVLNAHSAVRERMRAYSALVEALHVIAYAPGAHMVPEEETGRDTIAPALAVHPARSRGKLGALFALYRVAKTVLCEIPKNGQVLVTAQDPSETWLVAWLLKRTFGVPMQLQMHTDLFSPYFRKESLKNNLRVLLARFLLPRADCVRVVSERIKRSLVERGLVSESRIAVLPIFVDVVKIREMPVTVDLRKQYPQFAFIVFMASRLTREKNIGLAFAAMQEINNTHAKIGLIIAGEGPERGRLEADAARRGLETSVVFTGAVDFSTLVSCYKTADLFLLTSNYEGYGRTVIEAMAAGTPVMTTDVGVAGEIVEHEKNGFVIPVGDARKLAEGIRQFYGSHELRRRFQKNSDGVFAQHGDKSTHLAIYQKTFTRCYANRT